MCRRETPTRDAAEPAGRRETPLTHWEMSFRTRSEPVRGREMSISRRSEPIGGWEKWICRWSEPICNRSEPVSTPYSRTNARADPFKDSAGNAPTHAGRYGRERSYETVSSPQPSTSPPGRGSEWYQDIADNRAHDIADRWPGLRSGGERSEPERSGPGQRSARPRVGRHPDPAVLLFAQLPHQHRPPAPARPLARDVTRHSNALANPPGRAAPPCP